MTPTGWRLAALLAGVALVLLTWAAARKVTDDGRLALARAPGGQLRVGAREAGDLGVGHEIGRGRREVRALRARGPRALPRGQPEQQRAKRHGWVSRITEK